MAKKRVLLTLLEDTKESGRSLLQDLARHGLAVQAHVFKPDARFLTLAAVVKELETCQAWIILSSQDAWSHCVKDLALVALSLQGRLPIMLVTEAFAPSLLPTPLRDAECVEKNPGVRAALVAATYKAVPLPYRCRPHFMGNLGLWLEIGPAEGVWEGALFASGPAEPTAHGVGSAGHLPEKCILEYPVQGMKLDVNGVPACGFGVKNSLDQTLSYYVRLSACPDVFCFGPFPETDEPELHVINLAGAVCA